MFDEIHMANAARTGGAGIGLAEKLDRFIGSHDRLNLLIDLEAPVNVVRLEKRIFDLAVAALFDDLDVRDAVISMGEQSFMESLNYIAGTGVQAPTGQGLTVSYPLQPGAHRQSKGEGK